MTKSRAEYIREYRAKKKMETENLKTQQPEIPIQDCVRFMMMARGQMPIEHGFYSDHGSKCLDCQRRHRELRREDTRHDWTDESKMGADPFHPSPEGPKERTDMKSADDFLQECFDHPEYQSKKKLSLKGEFGDRAE